MALELELILVLVIIVVIVIVVYFIYESFPITDCPKYGPSVLPGCEAGKAYFKGLCYKDTWTASGGTKTDICTVTYPDCPSSGCTHYVGSAASGVPSGTQCTSATIPGWDDQHFGHGWYLTDVLGVNYCHRGGVYGVYCEDATIPRTCSNGAEFFEGLCYTTPCPSGYRRSAPCTCEKA